MKAGDKIRVPHGYGGTDDFVVEEFRHCLGFFESEGSREAGIFTPLCDMYCKGPDSVENYVSNVGSYFTNKVPYWMDLPK